MPPGLLIAAPASGSGKTTLALGLGRAFRNRGLKLQPFKSGPDYIDPGFHTAACGRTAFNLDSWAMPPAMLDSLAGMDNDADLILAEGSMGLFDGVAQPGATGTGASADIAARMGWPVLLVLDVAGQAQTAAVVARGFASFRPGVTLAGVILNQVASPRHEALVRAGMAEAGIAVLGALPRRSSVALPERHLGLVQAEEHGTLDAVLDEMAHFAAAHVDLDAVLAVAAGNETTAVSAIAQPPGQRIALARDAAFSFVYPHLIEGWRRAGAEILPFSPLADQAPDETADVTWLPGGYPELHAGRLAAAGGFKAGLRRFAATRPVHGECGGYMALGTALIDAEGQRHAMAGLLRLVTSCASRRMHLGYRRARLQSAMPGFGPGALLRGHEFHYSSVIEQADSPLAEVQDAGGTVVPETGSRCGNATGSFFHLIAAEAGA